MTGYKKPETIAGTVQAVHNWIKANRLTVADGEHNYACPVIGVTGAVDFEITLTVKACASTHGQLNVRRQQTKNDFDEVVSTIMEKKVSKLAAQDAEKRVLILERQHMDHVPKRIMDEMRKQAPSCPDMAKVDEVSSEGLRPGRALSAFESFTLARRVVNKRRVGHCNHSFDLSWMGDTPGCALVAASGAGAPFVSFWQLSLPPCRGVVAIRHPAFFVVQSTATQRSCYIVLRLRK